MTSTMAGRLPSGRARLSRVLPGLAVLGVLGLIGLVLGASLSTSLFPFTLSLTIAALLIAFSVFDTELAIMATLAFGLLLGVERRVLQYGLATGQTLIDPLFLIPPLVTLTLLASAARRGAFRSRTPLSSVVLGITLMGLVGALNPLQGTPMAAGIGLVIFLMPVLWFWIGRALVDDRRMEQVFALVAVFAVASALYGLVQTSGHFFSWDQAWINESVGYASLRIRSFVRGFGFSSSAAEYGKFLAAGTVVVASSVLARRRAWWLPALAMLAAALFLSGLRTTLVLTIVALGIIWGTRHGASIVQLAVYGALAVVVLFLVVAQVTPGASSPSGTDATTVLADRQVAGLTDPFNPRASTLQSHVGLVQRSFVGMIGAPIGQGTATITIAGKRFGTSAAGDTDVADAAIAFGVIGVALYVMLSVRLFRLAHKLAVRRGDAVSLAAIGVVVVSSLQWLNGGLYAANVLAWLTFGWIDRASAALPDQPSRETEAARDQS